MTTMDAIGVNTNDEKADANVVSPLPTEEDTTKFFDNYDMTHKHRGVAHIFNNETFKYLKTRDGSTADANNFKEALEILGFEDMYINTHTDTTGREMIDIFEDFNKTSEDIDCFVCAILSYGDQENNIYGYEGEVKLDELLSYMRPDRCPSLKGIPKLIFVQSCQISKKDDNVEKKDAESFGFGEKPPKIPIMADMLLAYSTLQHPASTNKNDGSLFMISLSNVLNKHGTQSEIMKLLTAVSNNVMKNLEEPTLNDSNQIPLIMSTLTKQLKFTAKK